MSLVASSALIALGTLASYSDMREGIVRNKLLCVFLVVASVTKAVSFALGIEDLISFIVNAATVCAVALSLYFFHIWAGGDAKLTCVMACLYPTELYPLRQPYVPSLLFAVTLAFAMGFIFISVRALMRFLASASRESFQQILPPIVSSLVRCVCSYIYLGCCHALYQVFLASYLSVPPSIVSALSFCFLWVASTMGFSKRVSVLIAALFVCGAGTAYLGRFPMDANVYNIILVLTLAFSRALVGSQKYKITPAVDVRRGDILSAESALMAMAYLDSDIALSVSEDLTSRLSLEEAQAVSTLPGEVKIVEKTPFAIFISLGFVTCGLMGVLLT